ncbi:MAG: prolyl oligopeptidase family serine peptidase [Acidobacteria bacterium]|nr:prolyl oligopeptidase family serine peptidase [Acidobacteriota bacterium]
MRLLATLLFAASAVVFAQPNNANYDESKVPSYTLPDPLVAADGTRISTPEAWREKRRPELVRLFESQMYGAVPPNAPKDLKSELLERTAGALGGKAVRKQVKIAFGPGPVAPAMEILLYLPANAKGPAPVFLGYNFYGNHSIHADPGIHLSKSWMRDSPDFGVADHKATEASRGVRASRWPVELILSRGYGLAVIYYGDVDPDFDDGFKNGVHALTGKPGPEEWGSVATWAWGLSRAMDYLVEDPDVDAQRVAVMGHSRLGKTSLWAGAMDERFAMVVSNDSGCGGAALSRRAFGETVERINTSFPHWFADSFNQYNAKESSLPVDQHELIALIAPRPVYIASAEEDLWADPTGEFLSGVNAGPVYELLGRQGLGTEHRPPTESPIHHQIGHHVRRGGHDVTDYDWTQWMDFADERLRSPLVSQLDRILDLKGVGAPAISPDGKTIAYTRRGEVRLVGVDGSNDRALAKGSEPSWSPDGRSIGYFSGAEFGRQIWTTPVAGGAPSRVTSSTEYIDRFRWAPDSQRIAYIARPKPWAALTYLAQPDVEGTPTIVDSNNLPRNRLWLVELASHATKPLTPPDVSVGGYEQWFPDAFSFSPDGATIAFGKRPHAKAGSHLDSEVAVVSTADGKLKTVTDRPGMDAYPQYSPDGKRIAFISTERRNWVTVSHIYLLDPSTGQVEKLTADVDRKIGDYSWSHDGKKIYFILDDGVTQPVYELDVAARKTRALVQDGKVYSALSVATKGPGMAFLRQSPTEPGDLYFTEPGRFEPRQLTHVDRDVAEWPEIPTEVIRWKSYDGLEIEGIVHKPAGYEPGKRCPLLVIPHGGPHAVNANGYVSGEARLFAERGWAVFRPNFRGSGGYGEAFLRADIKNWGVGDYEDEMSGVDKLIADGLVDPDRLAIAGASYGGYMSSWTISQTDRFKAAVIGAAITDTQAFLRTLDVPDRFVDYLGEDPRNYARHSPLAYGDRMVTPTLVWHGELDIRVPLMQGRALYVTLQKYGVPSQFLIYRGEAHGVSQPAHVRDLLERKVDWLERWTLR